jgi:porphobilinogen synthase
MKFPIYRLKRLRQNENFRRLIRETRLSVDNLVMPFFVCPGKKVKKPIVSMPGNFQLSIDNLLKEAKIIQDARIPAIMLFGIPRKKDNLATEAYADYGIIQQAVRELKKKLPNLLVVTDVCLCEYTNHGHCGILKNSRQPTVHSPQKQNRGSWTADRGLIDNDATLELLAKTALSHAQAGADMVAPSAMMDGQVKAIRQMLDKEGHVETPIMAYSAKYSSSFYGPFRQAAESAPRFGDRKSYQMDMANVRQALREVRLDVQEGADIVMVKPALAYLDVIAKVKDEFNIPLAAYNVSGEFSMVKAAAKLGWLDEELATLEILTAIKRAGADIIISYHAKEIASKLKG